MRHDMRLNPIFDTITSKLNLNQQFSADELKKINYDVTELYGKFNHELIKHLNEKIKEIQSCIHNKVRTNIVLKNQVITILDKIIQNVKIDSKSVLSDIKTEIDSLKRSIKIQLLNYYLPQISNGELDGISAPAEIIKSVEETIENFINRISSEDLLKKIHNGFKNEKTRMPVTGIVRKRPGALLELKELYEKLEMILCSTPIQNLQGCQIQRTPSRGPPPPPPRGSGPPPRGPLPPPPLGRGPLPPPPLGRGLPSTVYADLAHNTPRFPTAQSPERSNYVEIDHRAMAALAAKAEAAHRNKQ